ncbi:MAG: TonB-dependent receptor [Sphingomonadales bacterium]|nr:TonB-dependent receptor [Sphingomonadales bacterium]MDE2568445.1 TonB-dependent receptor [Sphingomonadales bacterium]
MKKLTGCKTSGFARASAMSAVLVGIAATAAPALAQGKDANQVSDAKSDANAIVVTAQKRVQDVQDVPISMAVVSGEKLTDMGVKDFTELDRYVPNFSVQTTPGNNAFYIRGIGSTPGDLALDQTVGLFVDGLYGGHARQFQAPFLDVERIEVLRGPQGALVGKNTSAGAINVITAKPTHDLRASLEGSYEFEYNSWRLYGMVSGPISDTVTARIAAQYEDNGGYMANTIQGGMEPGRKSFYGRAQVMIDSGGPANLLIKVEGGNVDLSGNAVESIATAAELKAGTTTPGKPDLNRATSGFPGYVGTDYDNTRTFTMEATANLDIGDHTLTSITGYSHYSYDKRLDSDFGPAPLFGSGFGEYFNQLSQELRLTSPTGGFLDYIVGIYGHINDYDLTQDTVLKFGPFNGTSVRAFTQEDKTVSAYASATAHLTERLRLIGSLRYTWEGKTGGEIRANSGIVPPTYLNTPLSGRISETKWDPSATIQYDVTPDIMIYATYGQGSKAGGFVGGIATNTMADFVLAPEKSETWEGGIKLAALDRRLRMNIALYRSTFSNLQVSSFQVPVDPVTGLPLGPGGFVYGNAGKARSQGVEADASIKLMDGIDLNAAVAYLDGKYLDFKGAVCPYNLTSCTSATFNGAGLPLTRSPKWSGNVGFSADLPLTNSLDFIASGSMTFRSFAYLEETYNPVMAQKAYQKFDLRAGIRTSDKRWELAVVGKNLTNKLTASQAFATPVTGGVSEFIQEPRTIAVQFKFNY